MRLHFLGICGTFMGSLALLARASGHDVSGQDQNVYPPMSIQLEAQGITLYDDYSEQHLQNAPDLVIVGNAISRGNPAFEYMLDARLPYTSGPQWLAQNILQQRKVIAVAGTHGKTTTSSMLAWILEFAGLQPGFLIGGLAKNFDCSARLGKGKPFVIEADEYDTALFDKRSKFIHYQPDQLIINNIEFDHADIFDDLAAIKRQFHHLLRTMPQSAQIIYPIKDKNIQSVLELGCWSYCIALGDKWAVKLINAEGSQFQVYYEKKCMAEVEWSLIGEHNVWNALSAIVAAYKCGVAPSIAAAALAKFKNVKRRLEVIARSQAVTVYDDFAHHPTEFKATIGALRNKVKEDEIIAVFECRSNSLKTGVHKSELPASLQEADRIICLRPEPDWGVDQLQSQLTKPVTIADNVTEIVALLKPYIQSKAHILIMSNGSFGGIYEMLKGIVK